MAPPLFPKRALAAEVWARSSCSKLTTGRDCQIIGGLRWPYRRCSGGRQAAIRSATSPSGAAASVAENATGNRELGTLGSNTRYWAWLWEDEMKTVIERVMRTYGLMVSLTEAQDQEARERLETFLRNKTGSDHELAVQGLQFLRGSLSIKRRTIYRINSAAKQSLVEESG
jgi:hypothetical protein